MFEDITKYKNCGNFSFRKGDNLAQLSKNVPEKPGVYYILRLAKGKVDLVYIGKSGTVLQDGSFKSQLLRGRLNNKQEGVKRQVYFDMKMDQENIDGLDIYWFVTVDDKNNDLPGFVEAVILQRFYETHGKLPEWNKEY
ncbi:hypothetical protein [Flavobacterium maritimum]|uniref:hypothetical protein n=1 Tax=Flavobacterium maritimum TaxID=3149042 RepID=UPI0032B5797F